MNPRSASNPDLLGTLARRTKAIVAALSAGTMACGVFAVWPLSPIEIGTTANLEREPENDIAPPLLHASSQALPPFDVAAFDAPVWLAPPTPIAETTAASTPAPPLRLQLLGIVSDRGAYHAVIYDPDADRVVVVSGGDTLAGRTIDRIGPDSVAIRDDSGVRTLALRAGGTR
ncbi:hypothetical protein PHYC_02000 [Phycisphaerales bacterium]|nr:hypothetical protein PHYC_02000 [Phycisphaerales bacterium]